MTIEEAKRQGYGTGPKFHFIEITMPCDTRITYRTFNEIPKEDVPCPCGNPKHWIVKYEVLEVK